MIIIEIAVLNKQGLFERVGKAVRGRPMCCDVSLEGFCLNKLSMN